MNKENSPAFLEGQRLRADMPYEHTTAVLGGPVDKILAGKEGGGRAFKASTWGAAEHRKVFAGHVWCVLCCAGPMDTAGPALKEPAVWQRRDSAAPPSRDAMAGHAGRTSSRTVCGTGSAWHPDRQGQAVFLMSLNCPV